jgi:hypothetical protein
VAVVLRAALPPPLPCGTIPHADSASAASAVVAIARVIEGRRAVVMPTMVTK